MLLRSLKNQKGQTAIEYLLIIAAAIGFGLTFLKQMDKYVIKNPNGIIGKPLNNFKKRLESDSSGRYRYYPLGSRAR